MNGIKKIMGAVVVAVVSAVVAIPSVMVGAPPAAPAPAASPASSVVDLKQVETAIIAVQGQIVAGNLDAGLKALQGARGQAVTADLASRVGFVAKLAEARMAEKLGDQAKALSALTEVFAMAKQPDQVQATFTVGLAMAQSAVASKGNAVPVVDFLAKGPGPAVKQFAANVELAKLRIATGNMGAAEAELRNAAQRVNSPLESATWVGAVNQLANDVDGGQAALAGAECCPVCAMRRRPPVPKR